jgi:hypothetical protein
VASIFLPWYVPAALHFKQVAVDLGDLFFWKACALAQSYIINNCAYHA